MQKIELKLTIDDINKVLIALADMPYKNVADLVEKIRKQAEIQIATTASAIDNVME